MSENSNRKTTGQYPLHTGSEAEQYSFYRVPAVMFSDPELKKLSAEAKLLYGLLLDRMGLSIKNEWLDKENHVYIYYTVDEIKDALGCGNKKAGALLAELDDKKGIGLITRVRQGLGRPDRIYVRKCVRVETDPEGKESKPEAEQEEIPGGHLQTCQNDTSRHVETTSLEMSPGKSQTCRNDTSGKVETTSQDMSKRHANQTDKSHNQQNQTESIQSNQNQSESEALEPGDGGLLRVDDAVRRRLAEEYADVDRLIDKALCGVKARENPTKIRNPYRYIRKVAENEHWPTRTEERQTEARLSAARAAQAKREAKLEAEKDAQIAEARKAGRIPGHRPEGGVLHV